MGGGGGKKSSARYGLKKTIACATTVAALASSASARRDTVDGAAFLETFDDGLDGWVKSEVEQYTGASFFSSSSSLCVFSRASRVCLAFSSPRARFESIEEQRERLRCIVHRIIVKNSDRKKSDLDVVLSHIGPTKPPRASQKVTMDRAKSIDRRVPMTQQSSNEYACPCFFLCVCAQKRVRFQSSGVFFVRGLTKSDTPFSSLCL